MTAFLNVLFGRLPIGWLQLTHNRGRLAAALAGVAFANILVFMQLGFMGALVESAKLPYRQMAADILIYSSDTNTLSDSGTVPRQRMFQALSTPGVRTASAVYIGRIDWDRSDGVTSNMQVFGIDPDKQVFRSPAINSRLDRLKLQNVGLIDRKTRNTPKDVLAVIDSGKPYSFEAAGKTLSIQGDFDIGAGFDADGYFIVSDQTFLNLFPKRKPGAPNYVFVTVEPGANPDVVAKQLRSILPAKDTIVDTLEKAAVKDQTYQTTERPVGIVFGFGVIIGILVGIVIVYQVLSTDVADHLGEYATFKAIGYRQSFFLGIVFEEALLLALLGFIPGILISLVLYKVAAVATGLPIVMTALRPVGVFFGTLLMCSASGAFATRRLAGADPADLF